MDESTLLKFSLYPISPTRLTKCNPYSPPSTHPAVRITALLALTISSVSAQCTTSSTVPTAPTTALTCNYQTTGSALASLPCSVGDYCYMLTYQGSVQSSCGSSLSIDSLINYGTVAGYTKLYVCATDNCNTATAYASCASSADDVDTSSFSITESSNKDALSLVSSGIAVPVVFAFVIMAGVFYTTTIKPKVASSTEAEEYKARARSSWLVVYLGNAFQILGFLSGLAAPSVPWIYGGSMVSFGSASGGGYCASLY